MTCADIGGHPVLELVAGDLLPAYVADASDCDGPFDFTGWTLTFEMAGPVTVTGAATGDASGVLTYVWADGDTDIPGDYRPLFIGVSPAPESKPRTFVVDGVVRITAP